MQCDKLQIRSKLIFQATLLKISLEPFIFLNIETWQANVANPNEIVLVIR